MAVRSGRADDRWADLAKHGAVADDAIALDYSRPDLDMRAQQVVDLLESEIFDRRGSRRTALFDYCSVATQYACFFGG